jgi:hypothetical protein
MNTNTTRRFNSVPISEALLFTGAFTVMGTTFGLVFLQLYGEVWARRWLPTLASLLFAVCLTASTTTILPFVEEALMASADNGSVARAATMSEPRSGHTATLLPDGRVLLQDGRVFIAGGYNDSLYPTNQTWIYQLSDSAKTKLRAGNLYDDALLLRCVQIR